MLRVRKIIVALLGCFVTLTVSAQHYNKLKASGDSIAVITKDKILDDLDEYAHTIKKEHVNPFFVCSKQTFFDGIARIKDSAANYDADQTLVELLKVNAMLGDEHTNIIYKGRDRLPFSAYWFEEGMYITATSEDYRDLLYSKILAVNGLPMSEVIEKVQTLIPDTNTAAIKSKLPSLLMDPFTLHGLRIAPERKEVAFTLVTFRGDTLTVVPGARDARKIGIHPGFDRDVFLRNRGKGNYWYRYIDSGNYIYFNYRSCFDESKEHLFKDFREELIKEIEEKHPAKIIIDLRENGGGYTGLIKPFIEDLARTRLNEKGKIYVLLGRRTFSAALLATEGLKNRTYAITVGEPTSGSVVHFGNVKFFKLPNTGLMCMYSTADVVLGERYDGSLRPDVYVPERFDDYSKGIDAALQYAITY